MASIAPEGIIGLAGIGTGIIAPKHSNRFMVAFYDKTGRILEGLSNQVVSIMGVQKSFMKEGLEAFGFSKAQHQYSTSFTVEDDISNEAAKGVLELARRNNEGFEIHIIQLDGNDKKLNVLVLKDCMVNMYSTNNFDYALNDHHMKDTELKVTFDKECNKFLNGLEDVKLAQGLAAVLGGLRINKHEDYAVTSAGRRHVCVSYSDLEEFLF